MHDAGSENTNKELVLSSTFEFEEHNEKFIYRKLNKPSISRRMRDDDCI